MGFFSKAFRSKDKDGGTPTPKTKKKNVYTNGAVPAPPPKPHWDDAWTRKEVEPEEIQELLRGCTNELKSRALDIPFLLLPFRPASDPSGARTFVRNYFSMERGAHLKGERLVQELLLTEPMILSSVMKWCWSRLAGGVVGWEAYELFRIGEQDSDLARDAFATFIPLSVESDARTKIIFDFFDLMSAIAAHGKTNGMGGRKLSRLAGWWAFGHVDSGNGFDGGYKSWISAADATSHLFFAYLRSLSPDSVRGINGISTLPISLQTLVQGTEYPPTHPPFEATSKVAMVVDSVSPTPFALLRRAKHFQYRDDDRDLQQFSDFEDPVQALTDECRRVLKSISSTNQSAVSTTKVSTSLGDASWSRFEDIGFGGIGDYDEDDEPDSALGKKRKTAQGLKSTPQTTTNDLGRPTTPSWADFLSSGFPEDNGNAPPPLFLPPDKILPPIDLARRGKSSQSHKRSPEGSDLEPGELASINGIELDDAFWWVWITSLAGEETTERKAAFGRCALIETSISGHTWFVIEELVKGAAPEPEQGAYIAEKKSRFTFGKKSKMSRTKSMGRKTPPPMIEPLPRGNHISPMSKTSIGPDQHARIQAAAAALQQKRRQQESGEEPVKISPRRARHGDGMSTKTNSVFTLQPVIVSEAAPAMKWANTYDKTAIRAAYLGNNFAGRGSATELGTPRGHNADTNASITPKPAQDPAPKSDYGFPKHELPREDSGISTNRDLPALPPVTPGETRSQARTSPPPRVPVPPAPLSVAPQRPTRPPPPAPLPVVPAAQPANAVAAQAAEVPLPVASPMESAQKPLPSVEGAPLQPSRTITESDTNGLTPVSSPESKQGGNKLKKQQGGGLKGFFGKKKGPVLPAPSPPADSTAVAAARAAYKGPEMKPNYVASNSLGRRLSGIGRRKTPPAPTPTVGPVPDVDEPLPQPPVPFKDEYASQASLSRIDSNEQRHADHEFRSFDQGPVDQPAFVPEESPGPSCLTTPERNSVYENEPTEHDRYEPSISSEEEQPPSPVQDRWAQIRKNAAERAGRPSEDKTEDGDDSAGEETIESRVARIKARVAELTGNMGPESGPTRT